MEGLPVSYSLNSGDNGNNWWGDFIGAAIGGAANLRPRMPRSLSLKPSSSIPLLPRAMRSRPAMKCRARPRSFSPLFVTVPRPPLVAQPPKSSLQGEAHAYQSCDFTGQEWRRRR